MISYEKIEELLYSYKALIAEVKNLEIEISEIEYIGCSSITYEEKSAPTNKFNSSVENEVITREKQISKLKELKFIKENQIKRINNALESLDERSREIIKLKYFDKLSNTKIATRLDLTEEWIWKLKADAIKQLTSLILIIN